MRDAKGRSKARKNNLTGMLLISTVALILLGNFLMQERTLQRRLDYYDSHVESLKSELEAEQARTKEIEETREYMKTDEYIESVARDRLGLVKENEIIFKEVE